MNNELKIKQKEDAKKGGLVNPQELVQELVPILKEYFVASVRSSENHIILRFTNKNQFIITVS